MHLIIQLVPESVYTDRGEDALKTLAALDNTSFSFSNSGFAESGNFMVTAERLNLGLEEIGAPFRIEMETLEFDVLND